MQEPPNPPGTGRAPRGWCQRDGCGGELERRCRSPIRPHLVLGLGRRAARTRDVGGGGCGELGFGNVKPIPAPEGSAQRLVLERRYRAERKVKVPDPSKPRGEGQVARSREVQGKSPDPWKSSLTPPSQVRTPSPARAHLI